MAKLDGVKVVNENTVEFNGFVYELVTDGGRVDDLIQCFEEGYDDDLTYEAFYEVVRTNKINDMKFLDDINDERSRDCNDDDWKVFRKSHAITNDKLTDAEGVVKIELPDGTKLEGTPSDLEKITRSMQVLQAEQGTSEEKSAENESEPMVERLQVGDYAKVIGESTHSGKVGDIVKIFHDDEDNQPFKCEDLQGRELLYPWFREHELVKATDEEVLEAKQALLKVSDYARVISNEVTTEECGPHKFEIGTIVKLHAIDPDDVFETRHLNGDKPWPRWVHRKDLEPLTKEEAEHITREAEEEKKAKAEKLKWAAIGREVGEIKDGDIVKVIDKSNTYLKDGDIGVVSDSYEYVKGYGDKKENSVGLRVNTSRVDNVNWLDVANVELIVPVEQRFDTVG
ncbi:hypothetical protein [Bacillus cytotoxicus]|uniref:hypothetical protein n=1 Tax=Bacillus cytotoxicus TaxID=580165 RepID=UPI0008640F5C|nr:hypothetical protein [Bacillus cytotoxicus]AWC29102.1 hypothetical protein CG483_012695 [Bacillus cytotoxicus]AWC39512.1 hypothetical protein CG480_002555 [Bacillus cytotoxicus]AWC47443.1 hypothetical protein CG478_002555 [Bacillus cytotoxicus]AWC53173.1 hypothetical protein CG477_012655 [Bacillus cytotoxicus]AWC57302.1 hypothetical protein CG476_012680 [Bacillus cytotoxicus]